MAVSALVQSILFLGGLLLLGTIVGIDAASASGAEFKVLSYNIRYLNENDGRDVWRYRQAAVVETIRGADVAGLQEVVAEQLRDVQQALPEFEWYGVGRNDGQQDGESVPIGWRRDVFAAADRGTFWLSPTPEVVGSRGWDAALPRIASWVRLRRHDTGKEILLLNTHFDHRGEEARRQSAIQIREWLSEHSQDREPVIMLGDLNATMESPPLRALTEPMKGASDWRLKNARDIASAPDPGPNSTWNGFQEIVDTRRIDFILVAGQLDVLAFETLNPKTDAGRFASDHLPIRARIGF